MKSAPQGNRPSKKDVVTIDDGSVEPQERCEKEVKKEPEAQQDLDLQKKLEEEVVKNQKLTRIAGEYLGEMDELKERVKVLENTIDSKEGVLDGAKKMELEKRNEELSKECEKTLQLVEKAAADMKEANEKIDLLEKGRQEDRERIIDLMNQLKKERGSFEEERVRDQERIETLTGELAHSNQMLQFLLPIPEQAEVLQPMSMGAPSVLDSSTVACFGSIPEARVPFNGERLLRVKREEFVEEVDAEYQLVQTKKTEIGEKRRAEMKKEIEENEKRKTQEIDRIEDGEPSVKKRRSESVEKEEKVVPRKGISSSNGTSHSKSVKKDSEDSKDKGKEKNELKCPKKQCDFRTRTVSAWVNHLKDKHSTTPFEAGCILRCDCGNQSYSHFHYYKCNISNATIIRRLQMTPQCVMCKDHPKTPYGYIRHLYRNHKSTLKARGIYLLCSCGTKFTTDGDWKKHDNKCSRPDYTLHKLNED